MVLKTYYLATNKCIYFIWIFLSSTDINVLNKCFYFLVHNECNSHTYMHSIDLFRPLAGDEFKRIEKALPLSKNPTIKNEWIKAWKEEKRFSRLLFKVVRNANYSVAAMVVDLEAIFVCIPTWTAISHFSNPSKTNGNSELPKVTLISWSEGGAQGWRVVARGGRPPPPKSAMECHFTGLSERAELHAFWKYICISIALD